MSWTDGNRREITKDDYDAIKSGRKNKKEFFSDWELCGYGASPGRIFEEDGKYFIEYGISDSCD